MRARLFAAALALVLSACHLAPAFAQNEFNAPGNQTVGAAVQMCLNANNQAIPCSTPPQGTLGAGYPAGATPVTASATGTTAGTTATLAAASGKFTYICGATVSPGSATAAITLSVTITGITNTFTQAVGAPVTAAGTTGAPLLFAFFPCIPSSAVNTGIAVAASALGTGGVNQDVNAYGYQE